MQMQLVAVSTRCLVAALPAAVAFYRTYVQPAKREHFSDAAADDGRKIFRSHLGISVIKLTPKEEEGAGRRRERRRRGKADRLLLRVLFPSRRVVTSLAAHSFIPTFPLAPSLARSLGR